MLGNKSPNWLSELIHKQVAKLKSRLKFIMRAAQNMNVVLRVFSVSGKRNFMVEL